MHEHQKEHKIFVITMTDGLTVLTSLVPLNPREGFQITFHPPYVHM